MITGIRSLFHPEWRWTTLLVSLAIVVTIRMGFWQLDRLQNRRSLITHVQEVHAMPELALSKDLTGVDLSSMEYRSVVVSGRFDFAHQVAIRNQVWTQTWGNEMGFTLLTPLVMDNGWAVLIQRGWIPLKYNTPESWQVFNNDPDIPIQGVIRLPLETGEMGGGVPDPTFAPGNPDLYFWNYVNIDRLGKQIPYKLLPVYIQQSPPDQEDKMPFRSLPILDLTEGSHLGYAIQWFCYSFLLFFGYPYYIKLHLEKKGVMEPK